MAFWKELNPFLIIKYDAPPNLLVNKQQSFGVGQHHHGGFGTAMLDFRREVERANLTGKTNVI